MKNKKGANLYLNQCAEIIPANGADIGFAEVGKRGEVDDAGVRVGLYGQPRCAMLAAPFLDVVLALFDNSALHQAESLAHELVNMEMNEPMGLRQRRMYEQGGG